MSTSEADKDVNDAVSEKDPSDIEDLLDDDIDEPRVFRPSIDEALGQGENTVVNESLLIKTIKTSMYEIFQKVFPGERSITQPEHCASPKSQNSVSDSAGNRSVVNYITDQTSKDPAMAVPGPVNDPNYSNTDSGNSAEQATDSVDAESHDLLQQMSSEYEPSGEKGPAVQEKLAKIFQDLVQGIHKEEKFNSVVDSINPPCNVEGLEVTKVNTEVWRRMSRTARSNDLKLQKLQTLMIKQMALGTITANKLHKAKSDGTKTTSEIIKLALK